jgi:hypothetical protein
MEEFEFGPVRIDGSANHVWELLEAYFEDRAVLELRRVAAGWIGRIGAPRDPEHYIDPNLSVGLEALGVELAQVPYWYEYRVGSQITLFDSWSLVNWCNWLSKCPEPPTAVTILHADAHEDLMSPRIARTSSGGLYDTVHSRSIALRSPETVKGAIAGGAIGIGSYIVPILLAGPRITIRHLDHSTRGRPLGVKMALDVVDQIDDITGQRRIHTSKNPNYTHGHSYELFTDPDCWADCSGTEPILVHVDADYFLNRYNGSSNSLNGVWHESSDVAWRRFDLFEHAMKSVVSSGRVKTWSLALSPGFFPATLWTECIERFLGLVSTATVR